MLTMPFLGLSNNIGQGRRQLINTFYFSVFSLNLVTSGSPKIKFYQLYYICVHRQLHLLKIYKLFVWEKQQDKYFLFNSSLIFKKHSSSRSWKRHGTVKTVRISELTDIFFFF